MIRMDNGFFHIATEHTSYLFGVDAQGDLLHHYYGARIRDDRVRLDYYSGTHAWSVYLPGDERQTLPLQRLPYEYSGSGYGLFYPGGCRVLCGGFDVTRFEYRSARRCDTSEFSGALPYALEPDEVLAVELEDPCAKLEVTLYYCVYESCDVIARAAKVKNVGEKAVELDRAMSLMLHFPDSGFDLIRLCGSWAQERLVERTPLGKGLSSIGSMNGESSHEMNPFFALVRPNTTNAQGEVYGFNLIYSGNWCAELYADVYGALHVESGIHPETLRWRLEPGESFETPHAVCTFSAEGLDGMSDCWHRFVENHICRGYWKGRKRPLLLNSWEATYFRFTEDSIVELAKNAAELGVELLVLDDGWFGVRENDRTSLGDWTPNMRKLPGGIRGLSERVHQEGLKFGLWFEPEMVNPDSDLFRSHPDWCIAVPDRTSPLCRNQLVLDYANPDVVDAIFEAMCGVLDSAQVEYVKWDMNRPITCRGSAALPADRQGEQGHRYVLGVYSLMRRLTGRYPELLIEGCSGGGGRFDLGILCYCPQIWCSDNTDPMWRLYIQNGTSYAYPMRTIGSHVSASPNRFTRRITPLAMRGAVALAGSFGYELDAGELTEEEKRQVREQVALYHETYDLVHDGRFYRLAEPGSGDLAAWQFVSRDGSESLVCVVFTQDRINQFGGVLRLRGLDEERRYHDDRLGTVYGGTLMHCGFALSEYTCTGSVLTYRLKAVD